MGTQLCYTADDKQNEIIEEIMKSIQATKSETIAHLVWIGINVVTANGIPKNYGDFIAKASGGTAVTFTTPAPFRIAQPPPLKPQEELLDEGELQKLRSQWFKALIEGSQLGATERIKKLTTQGGQRLFFVVKPLDKPLPKPGITEDHFIAINENLDCVELKAEYTWDTKGMKLDLQEKPVDPCSVGLDQRKIINTARRVIGGEL